jgi:hypothetical protein
MKTNFTHATIPLPGGLSFYLDGNSKITASNGTFAEPAPNAFSLPAASVGHGAYCPGSTPTCRSSCYVRGLARNVPDVYGAYNGNAIALRLALTDLRDVAARRLGEWIAEHARGGFRWHVSGDVWHELHASWIVKVCDVARDVLMWIYTRTLAAVPTLVRAENLAVNVSADRDNWLLASTTARRWGARITYMVTDGEDLPPLPPDSVIFPDYPLRGRDLAEPTRALWWLGLTHEQRAMVCSADFFGQSESARCGPCNKCLTKGA